jgi:hypothetical protein
MSRLHPHPTLFEKQAAEALGFAMLEATGRELFTDNLSPFVTQYISHLAPKERVSNRDFARMLGHIDNKSVARQFRNELRSMKATRARDLLRDLYEEQWITAAECARAWYVVLMYESARLAAESWFRSLSSSTSALTPVEFFRTQDRLISEMQWLVEDQLYIATSTAADKRLRVSQSRTYRLMNERAFMYFEECSVRRGHNETLQALANLDSQFNSQG